MTLVDELRRDINANRGQLKGQVVMVLFRIANAARRPVDRRPGLLAVPVGIVYRLVVEWILGVEIPWRTQLGAGVRIYHGVGIVINDRTVIGNNVAIRQNVTIGNKNEDGPCPIIEDDVEIGANAVVVGGIRVGRGARIAAGALVTRDVPAGAMAIGNPATIKPPRVSVDSPEDR